MTLFSALIAATLWANYSHANAVSTGFLNWLIWVQFSDLLRHQRPGGRHHVSETAACHVRRSPR